MPPCHQAPEKVSENDHVAQLRDAQLPAHRPKRRHARTCAGTTLQKSGAPLALGQLWTLNAGRRQRGASIGVQDCTCTTMASYHNRDTDAPGPMVSSMTKMMIHAHLVVVQSASASSWAAADVAQSWTLNAGHEGAKMLICVHLVAVQSASASSSDLAQSWTLNAGDEGALVVKSASASISPVADVARRQGLDAGR